ncbi:hypothetical protein [Streptomyces sp. NPDC005148]
MASRLRRLPYGHTALQERMTDEALVLVSGHRAQQPESLVRQALPTTTCSLANVRRVAQYEGITSRRANRVDGHEGVAAPGMGF